MTSADCLLLDAKHAILDEHHRKFQALHNEGRVNEAVKQFHVTLSCASDVLNDALRLLEDTLEAHRQATLISPPSHPSTN
ncbi:MAG TPA: hypothetical protein VN657_07495 [Nitrospiraceae bacterium]|jgi:hypothetical protein|nr:hypothetical protein [Nitrospiraceae bacterium]HZM23053.1 hypothetical protein [Anaerolineales bacterium]